MIRGPRSVKDAIAEYLAADLRTRLPRLRDTWELEEQDLPYPAEVRSGVPNLNAFVGESLVGSTVLGSPRRRRLDLNDGVIEYASTYQCRVFAWSRDPSWDRVQDLRDDLLTAVLISLLDGPTVGRADMLIDENTVTTALSDVQADSSRWHVAGSYVAFELAAHEVLDRDTLGAPLGPGERLDVDLQVRGYPPTHPAFDD